MRQFVFSVCACVVAVILYFSLKQFFGVETLSRMCILGAAPFAALGFIKYNGMTAEKFILTFITSQILAPKRLTFKAKNIYAEELKDLIDKNLKSGILKKRKEVKKKKVKKY